MINIALLTDMTPDDIIVMLNSAPPRPRRVFEFAHQFNYCILLALRTATLDDFWLISYQIKRTIDMVKIAQCIERRASEGPVDIKIVTSKPPCPTKWEDWFQYYQWELSQGIHPSDGEDCINQFDILVQHLDKVALSLDQTLVDHESLVSSLEEFSPN